MNDLIAERAALCRSYAALCRFQASLCVTEAERSAFNHIADEYHTEADRLELAAETQSAPRWRNPVTKEPFS